MRLNLVIGAPLVLGMAAAAGVSAVWTPYDPRGTAIRRRLLPPGAAHWLGTDEFGRDVLSRVMEGAQVSFTVALGTALLAVAAGTALGLLAGYARGWTDRVVMALNDALLAFPGILLALGIAVALGAGQAGLVLALGVAYAPAVVRVVRGVVLSLREREFVEASRTLGNGALYTVWRHVLPQCWAPVAVLGTSVFGWAVLAEAALSFLGLGVPPPAPSWGNMLAAGRPYMDTAEWLSVAPGACIAVTLLGVNLLGDALRDQLDPRMGRV